MKAKKRLGIIGGMGARASSILLQKIIEYSPAVTDQEFIEIILHSNAAIPDRTRAIVYNETSPIQELLRSVTLFNENKVEVVALACVTSYYFYKDIQRFSNATIIHPVPLIRNHIKENHSNIKRIGLLATTGTLRAGLFKEEFENHGLELVTLNDVDQEQCFMESVYMKNGLKSSPISEQAIDLLMLATSKLVEAGAEAIVGGCSEVSIALHQNMIDLPFIDAIDLMALESVNLCYDFKKEIISSIHEY